MSLVSWLFGLLILSAFYAGQGLDVTSTSMIMAALLFSLAYAQGDSITFMANTEGGPFGLGPATLLGMPNALEMQHIIQSGMGNKK